MSEPIALFVYGQLRSGEIGYKRLNLRSKIRSFGQACVAGRLYDFGDYPGLILGERGIVHGEILVFDKPALWKTLDAYELHDPKRPNRSEYQRIEVDLLGSGLRVWTYEFHRPIRNRPVIISGNWRRR